MSEFDERFSGVLGSDYDLFGKSVSYHEELQETVGRQIKDYIQKKELKDPLFLEAGIGTGLTTVHVLGIGKGVRVVGVDNEPTTLNQARQVLRDFSSQVTFVESDILTFLNSESSDKYDGFFSAYVIHNLSPEIRRRLIPEIARVLKQGGLYVNADKLALDDEEKHMESLQKQIAAFEVYDQMGRPEIKEEWTKHYLEDDKIRLAENEHVSLLVEAGFSDIDRVFREGMDAIVVARKL